jgi:hypothetical protein
LFSSNFIITQMLNLHWDSDQLLIYATLVRQRTQLIHLKLITWLFKCKINFVASQFEIAKSKTIERIQCLSAFRCWSLYSSACTIDWWFFMSLVVWLETKKKLITFWLLLRNISVEV